MTARMLNLSADSLVLVHATQSLLRPRHALGQSMQSLHRCLGLVLACESGPHSLAQRHHLAFEGVHFRLELAVLLYERACSLARGLLGELLQFGRVRVVALGLQQRTSSCQTVAAGEHSRVWH